MIPEHAVGMLGIDRDIVHLVHYAAGRDTIADESTMAGNMAEHELDRFCVGNYVVVGDGCT